MVSRKHMLHAKDFVETYTEYILAGRGCLKVSNATAVQIV